MKKFFPILLLAFVSFFVFSCDDNDDDFVQTEDFDTYAVAYDIAPVFTKVNINRYQFGDTFNSPLVESDVVLVYMQTGVTNGSPIWKILPYTLYVGNAANDEIDYAFDFSKNDVLLTVNSTFTLNLDNNPTYYTGKRFRVVVVPAATGKISGVDYNDYNSVVKAYHIDEAKIKVKK